MARGLSAMPFVLYRVSTTSPGKAVIRNTRRLGDLRIDVSGRPAGSPAVEHRFAYLRYVLDIP